MVKPAKPTLDAGHLWPIDGLQDPRVQICMLCAMPRILRNGERLRDKCKHVASKRIQDIIDVAWDAIEQLPEDDIRAKDEETRPGFPSCKNCGRPRVAHFGTERVCELGEDLRYEPDPGSQSFQPMSAYGSHLHYGIDFESIDPNMTTHQLMSGRIWQVADPEPKNNDFADLLELLKEIGTAIDDTPNPVEQYAELAHEILKAGWHR